MSSQSYLPQWLLPDTSPAPESSEPTVADRGMSALRDLMGGAGQAVSSGVDSLTGILGDASEAVSSTATDTADYVSDTASDVWGGLSTRASDAWEAAGQTAGAGVDLAMSGARQGLNNVGSSASDHWESASSASSETTEWVQQQAGPGVVTDTIDWAQETAADTYYDLTYDHFEGRHELNGEFPGLEELGNKESGWTRRTALETSYHDNGDEHPEAKYTHPDGREAVVDGATGEEMTEDRYMGTYNYGVPMSMDDVHGAGDAVDWVEAFGHHFYADMIPYYFGGSVRGEEGTGLGDRIVGPE